MNPTEFESRTKTAGILGDFNNVLVFGDTLKSRTILFGVPIHWIFRPQHSKNRIGLTVGVQIGVFQVEFHNFGGRLVIIIGDRLSHENITKDFIDVRCIDYRG